MTSLDAVPSRQTFVLEMTGKHVRHGQKYVDNQTKPGDIDIIEHHEQTGAEPSVTRLASHLQTSLKCTSASSFIFFHAGDVLMSQPLR